MKNGLASINADIIAKAARPAHTPGYTEPAARPLRAIAGKASWGLYDDHGRRIATISNKIANQEAYAVALAAAPETAAERDRLKAVNADLIALMEEATQPGGLGAYEFLGPDGWKARARAAIARAKGE